MQILRTMWFRILAAVVVVALVGWRIAASSGNEIDLPTADVTHGDLTLTLNEVGELKATRSATIGAPNDRLILFLAKEGSWVKPGELIVQLESEKYKIGIDEQNSAVSRAVASLRKAESDLEAQHFKEESSNKNYQSLLELKKKGFAMDSEVEEARLAYLELKSRTASYDAAVDQEKSNVQFAHGGLDQMKHKLEANAVYAPMAGLVVYANVGRPEDGKKVGVGDTPFQGQPLMYLPDISTMQVETEINEMDVQKIQPGQPVTIGLDAVPDMKFKGKVATVGNLAEHKVSKVSGRRTGVKVFEVTIDVLDADPRLRPGLSANAQILIDELKDVTYVPVEAVFNEDGKTVAYLKRGRKSHRVVVECGASNDKFVVIRSGLKPGDKVCLGQPS